MTAVPASEFVLIARYFTHPVRHTVLGVGDDAAVVRARPGMELVVTTDMLVCGTHFLADAEPESLGWKTLAVNISDIAAMGAPSARAWSIPESAAITTAPSGTDDTAS